jgi:hypothetical protein
MFDLKFFKRQQYFIKLMTCEVTNPKILNDHEAAVQKRSAFVTVGDMEDGETEEDMELSRYVYEEVMPHFGLTYRPPSERLMQIIKNYRNEKFHRDFLKK